MIFGAMLINDFIVFRSILKAKNLNDREPYKSAGKEEGKQDFSNRKNKNRRKKIAAASLAVFLFMLCPTTVSPIVSYTATVIITPAAVSQTLYVHQEQILLGGPGFIVCYLLKLDSADSAGTTLSAEAGTTGRKIWGFWVYQLTGVSSIPASTWTICYRAHKTHSSIEAHCDVDILIRMSNGTTRQTIATDVANSGALTTSWSTLSGNYSWADYTVVDETDYLEINFCVDVTAKRNNEHINLRIDDGTLAVADQTRAANVYLQ